MFIQSAKFLKSHQKELNNISIYGQEFNTSTWKMAHMNVAIRGLEANLGKSAADTFFDDQHPTLKADFIMANPPFNLSDWGADKLQNDKRWTFGIPPSGNANFAWIQHMIHHLSPTGRIGLVLANGALSSQTGGEGVIRRKTIEKDLVEGIIGDIRITKSSVTREDLSQQAFLGLIEAVNTYNNSVDISFKEYASIYIKFYVHELLYKKSYNYFWLGIILTKYK